MEHLYKSILVSRSNGEDYTHTQEPRLKGYYHRYVNTTFGKLRLVIVSLLHVTLCLLII